MKTSADTDWDLIDGIYDAVLERGLWDGVLERLASGFDDRPAVFKRQNFTTKTVEVLHSANIDPDYNMAHRGDTYCDPALNGATWLHKLARPGRFLRWTTVLTEERFYREEPVFEDVFRSAGISFDWAVRLDNKADMVSVVGFHRRLDQAPMPDDDFDRIRPLLPHFVHAMALMTRFDILDARLASLEAAVDAAGTATVVIGFDGTVQFVNEAAAQLLRQGDGLTARRNRLRAVDHATNARLTRLVHAVGQTGQGRGDASAGGTLTVPRTPPLAPLAVDVMPVATGRHGVAGPRPAAVVTVIAPDANPGDAVGRLAEGYGLSPMQARVAAALIDGKSQAAIANELAITRNTLKTHVRRLYDKLDCTSRADVIRLAAGLTPGRLR